MDRPSGSRSATRFGPYEVGALLGRGGMGEVYEAVDTVKGRTVALKVLTPHTADDPRYAARFRRESRLAAALNDPHVVPIHDWGEIDGVLFIDMRLVDGTSLGSVLRGTGAIEPVRAVAIVEQIASALDAAHAGGLVHRDVKPDNILLTPSDFAALTDFGIAFSVDETQLTTEGTVVGSCAYMAPERFGPDLTVGAGTDVYSLACVLHQMLTGTVPFDAPSIQQVISAHLHRPPPAPSEQDPRIPRGFDAVIARGMAKSPADRFASAGELARAARAALTGAVAATSRLTTPLPPPPPPPPPAGPEPARKRAGTAVIAGAATAVFVVAAVTAGLLLWPRGATDTPESSARGGGPVEGTNEIALPRVDESGPESAAAQPTTTTATAETSTVTDAPTTVLAAPPLRTEDDLGLPVPMTVPSCDGMGIVVVANAVAPGSYVEEIAAHLDAHPGASYLRTDRSCPSLRQATEEGNPIYAVYFPAGESTSELCSAVRARGGDAYGKWLDTVTDPRSLVEC